MSAGSALVSRPRLCDISPLCLASSSPSVHQRHKLHAPAVRDSTHLQCVFYSAMYCLLRFLLEIRGVYTRGGEWCEMQHGENWGGML